MTIYYRDRTKLCTAGCTIFGTLGDTTNSQNLMTLENAANSTVIVGLKKICVASDHAAASATKSPWIILARTTALPTGGTVINKVVTDTAETSSASVVCRGATASDAGVATAITATASDRFITQVVSRLHTAVGTNSPGSVLSINLLDFVPADMLLLRANQAIILQILAAGNNTNNFTHYANVVWEEYTS